MKERSISRLEFSRMTNKGDMLVKVSRSLKEIIKKEGAREGKREKRRRVEYRSGKSARGLDRLVSFGSLARSSELLARWRESRGPASSIFISRCFFFFFVGFHYSMRESRKDKKMNIYMYRNVVQGMLHAEFLFFFTK